MSTAASIAQMVAAQAASAQARPAVVDEQGCLTYGALSERAGQLAARLAALGAGPDQVVALVLPRSADLVVAALATLQSGAAYAPFDPTTPPERLRALLADTRPCAVVTRRAWAPHLSGGAWSTIALDTDMTPSEAMAPAACEPGDLAYVIYTSGSTGRPKGVEVTQAGLLNLVQWHRGEFAVTAADRASLLASPGFDASVWEIWPYLTAGGSLHVVPDLTRLSAEALRDWLVENGITVAFVPTPIAERLLALSWPTTTRLRTLLTGADTLHHRPPAGLPFTLVNNYGPTECTVVATSAVVPSDPLADGLPSIGWPIPGVTAHVLDEQRRLVAAGVEGELYLGGVGVARGYRGLPELTAERFVPDPFSPEGSRLYRTGDRVRRLADGSLTFLGRIDDQVKVRGHRIEPDEVVAVLDTHPGVTASAVAAWPGPDGENRLVAYLVTAPGSAPTPAALCATLQARLPDYMLPAVFVTVDALPLTVSGKVDRARLPSPESLTPLRDPEYTPPRTAVETQLAALIGELLGVAQIGRDDNFFLLGGHSLLGTQLVVRLRDAFGVDLPLRAVFDHPTVADLAAEVEQALVPGMQAA